ncbi:hypothetical protein [Mycoplasmopsis cynos]|uniref:hypothetical protein n=1 Tax=Mycoplasmopsis cynos TaxID=171284 RepID=UPI0021FF522E|nr:hypothetical protein [Mycoplasmopsis cynos]UWV93139.1 hypothetical protein NWE57_01175 [Mycoplasmopsis cynos]
MQQLLSTLMILIQLWINLILRKQLMNKRFLLAVSGGPDSMFMLNKYKYKDIVVNVPLIITKEMIVASILK